jgi:hypothetical protein
MLNAARLPKYLREGVWPEAANYATEVENVIVTTTKPITALHQFYGITNPKVKVMKSFGEMAIVEDNAQRKIRAKLENRGRSCLFLGHAPNHADDTYCFMNLTTKKVLVSRDVVWLGKCYGDWRGITSNVINAVPTDTNDSYFIDDLIDDQKYPSYNQGRVMEPDGGMVVMVIILLLSRIMKRIPGEMKMWKITTTLLPIQTMSS